MNRITEWLNAHPKAKQWAWFFTLWCGGLGSVLLLGAVLKGIMRLG